MSQRIRIYLLDDDPVFLRALQRVLEAQLQSREYDLFVFEQGEQLLSELESPDLFIADIDLGAPGMSGLEVARRVRQDHPHCEILFLTAFLSYATEIYEVEPLYFILKEEYESRIPKALQLYFSHHHREVLSLTVGREQLALPFGDIHYCERMGKKTRMVLTDRELMVGDTIDALMGKLPEDRFAVCHKGYLVALSQVASHTREEVTLRDGTVLPISRSRQEQFRENFSRFLSQTL